MCVRACVCVLRARIKASLSEFKSPDVTCCFYMSKEGRVLWWHLTLDRDQHLETHSHLKQGCVVDHAVLRCSPGQLYPHSYRDKALLHQPDFPHKEAILLEISTEGHFICALKGRLQRTSRRFCTVLLALLMTEVALVFSSGARTWEGAKVLLVKGSGAADSVLSDNQDKAARVSSPLKPFPLSVPIPGWCGIPREGQ